MAVIGVDLGGTKVSAALFLQVLERSLERFGTIRHTVSHSTEVRERYRVVRNNDRLHVLYSTRQIRRVILIVRVLSNCQHADQRQSSNK